MQRLRDESRWEFTRHAGVKSFLGAPNVSGAHAIKVGNQFLDVLVEDRQSPTTVVVFHSALNERQETVPVLQGHGIAERAGVNLVSVSDPSIALGDVDLAWYLGNRSLGDLRKHLSPVIRHAVQALGTERLILFGASGGGYAAVNFGNDFPESTVLAINPRLDLSARPHPQMGKYIKACHGASSPTPMLRIRRSFVTEQVAESIGKRLRYNLLLFQNLGDRLYLEDQALPFIDKYKSDPKLFVRFEEYAEGHKPIPRALLDEIMAALATDGTIQDAINLAAFTRHPDYYETPGVEMSNSDGNGVREVAEEQKATMPECCLTCGFYATENVEAAQAEHTAETGHAAFDYI